MRWRILIYITVLVLFGGLVWQLFFKQRTAKNYNVILISIDTCRADFIGAYGNSAISTPNLDSLAKQGILFDHFYSSINTTLPSHASMLTGLYPRHHGVARNAMRLGAQNETLGEYLKSQGYSTAAFIGSFALASVFGLNQGFDVYEESFMGDPSRYIGRSLVIDMKDGKTLEALEPDTRTGDITRPAEDVKASFERWLSKNKDHKFFAFIHFYDPHFPYLPPEKWYRKHLASIPERTPLTEQDRINFYPNFKTLVGSIENFRPAQIDTVEFSPVVDALVHLYTSEIEYVDSVIGELVKDLDRSDLRDHTILIVTSDHGENLVEHSRFNSFFRHGLLTYQTETRVPFLISSPGLLEAGLRVSEPASQLDIFPTLVDLLGLKTSLRFDGKSLYPVLSGKDKQESTRLIFAEASQPRIRQEDSSESFWPNNENSVSVWYGEWKYTRVPWKNFEAIFRVSQDELEENNLIQLVNQKNPELLRKLQSELSSWQKNAGNIDKGFTLSKEEREKLESLGYVQ